MLGKGENKLAIVKITRSDLSKYKRIDPVGWYAFEISEVKPPHSNKDQTGQVFETVFKVLHDSNNGISNAGIEVSEYPSTNTGFKILEIAAAAEGVTQEELLGDKDEMELEYDNIQGKKVWAEVYHEEYRGNLNNKLRSFMPYGGATPF
ncbi:hypothetical protein LCGC14_2699790 [marine sediment metagenome]|uniref:Uncharacterized protein n=2 Tax=marine sediment metagenome TaxID=412755 RepID=A0A0F9C7V4_9ZZZZ